MLSFTTTIVVEIGNMKYELGVVYPYYNNKEAVKKHLEIWSKFKPELRKRIQFVLVDDCSDEPLEEELLDVDLNLIVARVTDGIKWNQSGAHNLGFSLVESEWVFTADIDHFLNETLVEQMLELPKEALNVYYFQRYLEGRNASTDLLPAPNIMLINRNVFWILGGYDEDFAGNYGYEDKLFLNLIKRKFFIQVTELEKIKVLMYPTKNLSRDLTINKRKLDEKTELLNNNQYKNEDTLRFRWIIHKTEVKR